ncbi:SGNH/GDSL hydrolase family protein [Aeromicrobium wangtongii]|uniref:SGNH/GDSL hydrolase family protein n=1 Tax=Aeromicrobium wangtongii TaxID=2969247 RepID=UPI0020174195|nr:SGNH/GDSL hydrolase family protein [Aeromicrobium wangtongii]MCL3818086.1 SGNH/GDSL hydrolase family protein [Aeromicrobium wangtongii]
MTVSRATARRPLVVAFVLALVLGPFVAWQGAQGGQSRPVSAIAPQGIVVVGDSITARYNNTPGDPGQAWWSVTGRHFDATVRTYAQSGSGYLRPGHRCSGNRFIDRPDAFTGDAPSILIVEGGRNDWAKCVDGRFVPSTNAEIRHAVATYLTTLRTYVPSTTRILVLGPPWGPMDRLNGRRITRIVQEEARAHDMEFISTRGALTADRVVDGIHPNRDGSLAIARRVIRALES